MKEQVLASKLRIPRTMNNCIRREHMLTFIYNSSEPIVIMHAGMGYGKTTMMIEYVQTYRIPYEWYQLERGDNDISRFLRCFETLIQKKVKQFRFHEEPEQWSQEVVEQIAEYILEQLESSNQDWNIILDDFQYIQNPLIYYFLRFFIQYMESHVRIFILLRGEFPGFLTKFMLQGSAIVLEEEDFKITKEELETYMQEHGEELKGNATAEMILACTEGWALAVNSALLYQKEAVDCGGLEESCLDMPRLSDYLLYEILNPLTVKQQEFMIESAALVHITPEACDFILNTKSSKLFLDFFVQQQLLTQKEKHNEYQYHSVLKSFLLKRVDEERKYEIWNRAAEYYLEMQDYDEGIVYQNLLNRNRAKRKNFMIDDNRTFELICFGELQIISGDKDRVLRWRTRKTKEMFAYFWEQQGRFRSKEEIIDVLWQEGDGQNLEALFHTTLSYLKRIFMERGIPDLIQAENKKYRMQCQRFYSDSQKLCQLYEDWKQDNIEIDVEKCFIQLNQVYQGEYMKEIDTYWIIPSREHYQETFLKCCELLADKANAMHHYELSVQILEQAVAGNPYSERLNGMLLKNLGELGEIHIAKRQYEKYRRLMREELDVEIGSQVQEIYQKSVLKRIS